MFVLLGILGVNLKMEEDEHVMLLKVCEYRRRSEADAAQIIRFCVKNNMEEERLDRWSRWDMPSSCVARLETKKGSLTCGHICQACCKMPKDNCWWFVARDVRHNVPVAKNEGTRIHCLL